MSAKARFANAATVLATRHYVAIDMDSRIDGARTMIARIYRDWSAIGVGADH